MIAIDTSAIVAMVMREPEADKFASLVQANGRVLIGAPTLLELRMVTLGRFPALVREAVDALVSSPPLEVVDFTNRHEQVAIRAFQRYGKGIHPAGLNFGDCMSYAIAEIADCPLLFKGEDFARTDIRSALA